MASWALLIGALMASGYIYLLLYNTEAALRIAGGVFTVLWRVLQGLFNVLVMLITGVMNLFGKLFGSKRR